MSKDYVDNQGEIIESGLSLQLEEILAEFELLEKTFRGVQYIDNTELDTELALAVDRPGPLEDKAKHNDESERSSGETMEKYGRTEGHDESRVGCQLLMTGKGLQFQLRLSTLGDVLRLFCAKDQQVSIGSSLLGDFELRADGKMPRWSTSTSRCTVLFRLGREFQNTSTMVGADLHPPLPPRLADFLFHVYASNCLYIFQHPDRAELLERYYSRSLPATLLYPALAWAAAHTAASHSRIPYQKRLPELIPALLMKAKTAIEDAFDIPAEDTVLGLLTMWVHESENGNTASAHMYLKHAVVMARILNMEREHGNSLHSEMRRRIWCSLCVCDLLMVATEKTEPLIPLETILVSPHPKAMPGEGPETEIFLMVIVHMIGFFTRLFEIPELDLTQPDSEVVSSLVRVSILLKQRQLEGRRLIHEKRFACYEWAAANVHAGFNNGWGHLWRRFLEARVPPERYHSPLMRELRDIAVQESAKVIQQFSSGLQEAARLHSWCRLVQLDAHVQDICHLFRCLSKHLPGHPIYIQSALSLAICVRTLGEQPEKDYGVVKRICHELVKTLEATEPGMLRYAERKEKRHFRFKSIQFP
ncbi:uncharacterized protein VTP21DRAFT_10102 [Calcarisporiella thermophila]|uniref:uncharacterized protein n=1 Tax=Calcarisporiella thermophila TaxID=911321 RepID=UPI003742072C